MLIEFIFRRRDSMSKWKNFTLHFKFKDLEKRFFQLKDEYRESYKQKLRMTSDIEYLFFVLNKNMIQRNNYVDIS